MNVPPAGPRIGGKGNLMRICCCLSPVLLCLALPVGSFADQTPGSSGPVKKAFLTRQGEQLLLDGKPFRAVGANKWELLNQYVAGLYGDELNFSNHPPETSKRLALKALDDMAGQGINVILVMGCPFYSAKMQKTYLGDEEQRRIFWQRFDEMLDDCAQRRIRVILSIGFSYSLWPDIAHESLNEFVCNPHSKSRRLFDQWVRDLTGRYKDNPTVLFWELLTEGNLFVDLRPQMPEGILHATPQHLTPGPVVRDGRNHITSDELTAFHRETTHLIKSVDPNHMVGTGYAMTRPSSWHLWMGSCRRATKMDWTLDTDQQRADYLRLITPEIVDLMCVHFYLGTPEKHTLEHLAIPARVASELKRPLYIGECGPLFPNCGHEEAYAKQSARVGLECILEAARVLDVQIAMTWDWDEDCSVPHEPVIWPDRFPEVVALIKTAQAKAQSITAPRTPGVSPEALRRLRELDRTWQSVFEEEQKAPSGLQ